MADALFSLPSPEALFQEYDRQRRLALNRIILPIYIAIDILGIVAIIATPTGISYTQLGTLYPIEVGIAIALCVSLCLAYIATRREMVVVGTNLGIVSVVLTTTLSQVFNLIGGARGTFINIVLFTAFGVAIVLAGGVGVRITVILTTVWMNLVTIGTLTYISMSTPIGLATHQQAMTLFVQELIYQWAFAGLILGIMTGYRRVVHDIGDLRYAVERARRLDDLKDQFISSVNHELRNPIMALQGHLALLKRGISRQRAYPELTLLASNADRICDDLADLVQSILDIRRDASAQPFTPMAVPVRATVERAATHIDPREGQMLERELRLSIPATLMIWGDRIRLEQVITNLLSNAIKYSAPGTPIEIHAMQVTNTAKARGLWRQQGHLSDMVELRVRDYGLGIPPGQVPLLFQRFVRLPRDLQSPINGNGLGLYLSRLLVESMGGQIAIDSTGIAGEGTTFCIRLPYTPAVDAQPEQPIAVATPS